MAKDDTKELQDAYDKLPASARRKFISEQKSTEEEKKYICSFCNKLFSCR